jgi:DNA (cytosine-5)-methyltransferase 1
VITVTDLFCGGGGSSTGLTQVPGFDVVMAANHWQLAVDVHNRNHPTSDHAAVDLHEEDPRYFPRTDVLWASPECTKWSQANGSRPLPAIEEGLFEDPLSDDAATRSRLLMFDVLRFAEHHRYRAMIIENVVDIATQPKYRMAWTVWRKDLGNLGYRFRVISLNSMHAQLCGPPAPQSRDRIYIACWRIGDREPDFEIALRPRAWCARCELVVESTQAWKNGRTVGRYRQQYIYIHGECGAAVEPGWLPAAAAIDWSILGKRIGDRDKPLAEKTRRRIAAGIARYWRPFTLEAAGNTYDGATTGSGYYRAWPVDEVLTTLHTTMSKALAVPLVFDNNHSNRAHPIDEEMPTLTTATTKGLLAHSSFLLDRRFEYRVRDLDDPLSTLTANDTSKALLTPLHVSLMGGGETHVANSARPVDRELRTLTAEGNNDYLLAPYYGSSETARPVDQPIGTLTTVDRYALVTRHNGSKGDGAEMTTPADEYLRTLTTTAQQSIVTPGDIEAAEAQVDDCLFRMLEPHEVAAGMAFPDDYQWDGTRRERVRLAGNAVTPPAARDLGSVLVETLGGAA